MRLPFGKKSPADRRAETAKRLAEAESQAKAAQEERLRLALAGEATDAAEEQSWKLAARVKTLNDALAALDAEIAAEAAAAAAAERQKRRDDAAAIARKHHGEVVALRAKLVPLINEARALLVAHDAMGIAYVGDLIAPASDRMNAALYFPDKAREGFEVIAKRIERGDAEADDLAKRVLKFEAPEIQQVQ